MSARIPQQESTRKSPEVRLLSGNEALALGAYHAGLTVAAAYPGTPSSEILESIAKFDGVYAEWSTNEKVAMEVVLGASYAGARSLASMKQVGLNVASDPFMAAATTGVNGGIVVVSCDDPGIHSSQNEQDNRHYARLAKVPMLEPGDSQEAYDFMALAFHISETFDTPVLLRSTTRLSHSKSTVRITGKRGPTGREIAFHRSPEKYVMLPSSARLRHPLIEERLVKLAEYAETFAANQVSWGDRKSKIPHAGLGIIASGIAYQYAREVFTKASFLKLGMTYPLPQGLIRDFASKVARTIVIEELDPFLEESIKAMGIKVSGKEFIPRVGELTPVVIEESCRRAGLWDVGGKGREARPTSQPRPAVTPGQTGQSPLQASALPKRPPLLCSGCPHAGIFFILSSLGQRSKLPRSRATLPKDSKLIITGDIGCYTLGAYPPRNAMDTCACMGASIGQALGMEKAGLKDGHKIIAVIGDSTFMHSGITPLINAVYNEGHITVLILDNGDTAMTGHQPHPGVGVSARGQKTQPVVLEKLVEGIGVKNVKVVDAFNLKAVRSTLNQALDSDELSVVIVRGPCSMLLPQRSGARCVEPEKCNECEVCLMLGCPAIRHEDGHVFIDGTLCVGNACTLCEQICPRQAIGPQKRT
ncbi:MAG: indolepyruvate ferredoxin oxidoreductase subunit alpha [Chloroflexi bacterium]|nr:indolepyruvate ferredoxin oxidoreductase subunit alpha [Chloroflexota bacterium]MBI4289340.1 indolepyruvate ferredoxin oxidoreductase subunit alpha [Chloroflexota bacterium]